MEKLKELRLKAGLTQEDIAAMSKCSREHYTRIETGKIKPSIKLAKVIASKLNFDWKDFY